jgi:phosphoribosylglycinamide formyltransferase-1
MNIAVVISGSGSNLQALIDQQQHYGYRIAVVLSNVADAYGLVRAQQAGIDTLVVNHRDYETREAFEQAMNHALDAYSPELVVLAGFMRILTPVFIDHFSGKLLNIHPALLPKFKGLHTHARAIEENESEHGASVHFVTAELDGGPVIAQARVPVLSDDTPELLAKRVLAVEHQLYPAVVGALARNLISSPPDVRIDGVPAPIDYPLLQQKVAAHALV